MILLHLLARGTAATLWRLEDAVKDTADTITAGGELIGKLGYAVNGAACYVDELVHAPARVDELSQRVARLEANPGVLGFTNPEMSA